MIPGTVGARHPRPKPDEKIRCTFYGQRPTIGHRGLEPDRTKFLFFKMGNDDVRSVSGHRRGFMFL